MKQTKKYSESESKKKTPTPITPEARQDYLISLAMQRAEERLLNGTASSSEIVHFLRLGTEKERLELEKSTQEVELLKARTSAIASAQKTEEMYQEAIAAMKTYSGSATKSDEFGDDDEELY